MDTPQPPPAPGDDPLPPPPGYGPLPGPPPPYYAPRPPSQGSAGLPKIVWVVLGLACGLPVLASVIVVVAGIVAGYNAYRSGDSSTTRGSGLPPGVVTGNIAWQEIKPQRVQPNSSGFVMPPMYGSVLAGDFDGDGNDELYVEDINDAAKVIRLDGSLLPAQSLRAGRFLCAWDCNGDGKAELVRAAPQGQGIECVDLQDHVVKKLPYAPVMTAQSPTGSYPLIGDADGDGKPELWLSPLGQSGQGIVALDSSGKEVASERQQYMGMTPLVGEFDGPGRAVCIFNDNFSAVQAVGVGGTRKIGDNLDYDLPLSGCLDVNSDGQPDLVCGEEGYLDHASRRFVRYKHHSNFKQPYSFTGTNVQFDYDGDGTPELVYAGPDARAGGLAGVGATSLNGRLRIFQPRTQQVLYDEVISQGYSQTVLVVNVGGKPHLVVPERSRLRVYP